MKNHRIMKKIPAIAAAILLAPLAMHAAEPSGVKYDWTVTHQPERPYMHDYSRTMMMKFYMSDPNREEQSTNIFMDYEKALETIKGVDHISRGVPKIVYLVGWQFDGHDDRYPDFDVMNEALKRPGDANALESYRWLRREAKKHNTNVSVHLLISDAYTNAPSWDEYVRKGYICRDEKGKFMSPGVLQGYPMYWVNLYNEWKGGDLQKRLDHVVDMLDIKDAGTMHFDAFLSNPSPWHGVTKEMQEETMRKVLRYMRDKGVDITAELACFNGRDPMIGLQPAAWWNDMPAEMRAATGLALAGGGVSGALSTNPWPEIGFLFGDNAHAEDTFHLDLGWDTFIKEFCTQTLPYMLYGSRTIEEYDADNKRVTYSGNLVADAKTMTLTDNGRLIRQDNDLLIAPVWVREKELIAYSEQGFDGRDWKLPSDWKKVRKVDVYSVGPEGDTYLETLPVRKSVLNLSVPAGKMYSIRPAAKR